MSQRGYATARDGDPPPSTEDRCIDFAQFQAELDAAFHAKDDAYPAGSPEHAEMLHFLQRLHRLRQQQK